MNAFELAAQELGITAEEVERAVRISTVHRKHRKNLREQRRLANVKALNRHELEENKAKYPNQCFCVEEGLIVTRDWHRDRIIRSEKVQSYSILGMPTEQWYDDPVYACSNCGKEYRIQVAMA